MASKKKTEKNTERTPADKLLLDFIKENDIVLILDEIPSPRWAIKNHIYTVDKKPRLRVVYGEDLEEQQKAQENGKKQGVKIDG